jgi:N-acetyl-beta-hexosaminidase
MDELIAAVEDPLLCPPIGTEESRTAVVWDETIVELRKGMVPKSPRTVAMLWRDDRMSVDNILQQYREAGAVIEKVKLVLTPKTRLYFDYLQHPDVAKNRYWPLQRPAPWMKYKAVSLERAFMTHAMQGDDEWGKSIVHGVEGCLWTELIANVSVLEYQLFPRLYALADAGWTCRRSANLKKDFELFKVKVGRFEQASEGICRLCAPHSG